MITHDYPDFDPTRPEALMPLDRVDFQTNLRINPDALEAPGEHIRAISIPEGAQDDGVEFKLERLKYLELPPNGSIRLTIREDQAGVPWLHRAAFNVGKLRYSHNGGVPTVDDFVAACIAVCEAVEPLLLRASDANLLIPGCSPDSPSFWRELEIVMHLWDPDNSILARMRNICHPRIRKKATIHDGESIKLGSRRSDLTINIYRKDFEMERMLKKVGISDPNQVLRVEVTLRKQDLVRYLAPAGSSQGWKVRKASSGVDRSELLRFSSTDLDTAHKLIMRETKGIKGITVAGELPTDEKLGRFIGLMARDFDAPLEEILETYLLRFPSAPVTVRRLRKAAREEASISRSRSGMDDLFSDECYLNQPIISVPQFEAVAVPVDAPSPYRASIERAYAEAVATSAVIHNP